MAPRWEPRSSRQRRGGGTTRLHVRRAALLGRGPTSLHHAARLGDALSPRPGENLLEVGPGTGYYTIGIAKRLAPSGTLHIFDLRRKMLDHTMTRTGRQGLRNIETSQGDARRLPCPDESFDGAYLVAVLGEIPDRQAALRELRRVVKASGRVVVGELFGDPHMVGLTTLAREATGAGLELERRVGPRFGYFAVLRRPR